MSNIQSLFSTLSEDYKFMNFTCSRELLYLHMEAKHHSSRFLNRDESWFYFAIEYETQWTFPNKKPKTRSKKIISFPKRIISVFGLQLTSALLSCYLKESPLQQTASSIQSRGNCCHSTNNRSERTSMKIYCSYGKFSTASCKSGNQVWSSEST